MQTTKSSVWEWYDDSQWVPYAQEQQSVLEDGFKAKKTSILTKVYGNNYTIHYNTMKQENMSSHYQRNIRRREVVIKGIFEVEQRFQTHISTDKPLYKLNDTVYIRGVLLSATKQQPLPDSLPQDFYLGCTLQILGPKGDIVHTETIDKWNNSVLSATWKVPETSAGGKYIAKFKYKGNGLPASEREFEIRAFQNPRLNSQIEFLRKGLGAGDKAVATLNVTRAEGGAAEGATVTITARVDGNEVYKGKDVLDKKGNLNIGFTLPKKFTDGDGTLICVIDDKGVVETATKTIPILMNYVDVKIYPEGGDLVENLECGLYIEAFTKQGEPADIMGNIVDEKGNVVTKIITSHEGRGKTLFTPKGGKYFIQVTKPSGIKDIQIPDAKKEGLSMISQSNIYECDDALSFKIGATKAGKYLVTISKKEAQLTRVNVNIKKDMEQSNVVLTLPSDVNADGVLRITVTDPNSKPVAERLIFRRQTKKIKVTLKHDYKSYSPGDKVKLRILTTDEDDKPIKSLVSVTVSDESVIQSIEKRKHHPQLDTMVYLESEVDHLEDATMYLSENQLAPLATDLLLGTQGWRRFAYVDPISFMKNKGEKAERFMCVHFGEEKPNGVYESPNYFSNQKSEKNTRIEPITEDLWYENTIVRDESEDDLFENMNVPTRYTPDPFSFDENPTVMKKSLPKPQILGFSSEPKMQSIQPTFSKQSESIQRKSESKQMNDMLNVMGSQRQKLSAPKMEEKKDGKKSVQMDFFSDSKQIFDIFGGTQSQNLPKREEKKEKELKKSVVKTEDPFSSPFVQQSQRPPLSNLDDLFDLSYSKVTPQLPVSTSSYVREFAFKIKDNRKQGDRVDFTETLYWNAGVLTDDEGRAVVEFDTSDSITSFRAKVDAFSKSGIIGCGSILLVSKEPFYLEPKLVLEVSNGDLVKVPVSLVNSSQNDLKVQLLHNVTGNVRSLKTYENQKIALDPEEKKRVVLELEILEGSGKSSLEIEGKAGEFYDKVVRTFNVAPSGFPSSLSTAALLEEGKSLTFAFTIPKTLVKNSLTSKMTIFTSTLSNLSGALTSLLKSPYGCFEQTSSTTYPTVMALQYFISNPPKDVSLIRKSNDLIKQGYDRLITFECKDGGYEWFANGSGHEGLTALAILEFSDMSKVHPVDLNMLERTKKWLLERRDKKGGFVPNKAKSYQFGGNAPDNVKFAYICWALSEAHISREIELEIDNVYQDAKKNVDAYTNALAGITLFNTKKSKEASEMASNLIKLQKKDGSLDCQHTITYSGGISKKIEATSLAILCWLNDYSTYANNVENALQFLFKNSNGGSFGSTQGTILALKAIVAYEKQNKRKGKTGRVQILVDNDTKSNFVIDITPSDDPIEIDLAKYMTPGDHTVSILMGGCSYPYSLNIDYHSTIPENSDQCVLDFKTKLSSNKFKEGDGGEILVSIENKMNEKQGMTMGIIGLPGGLEPRHDQLKELVKSETIDFYEIKGRDVIIYKRGMAAKEKLQFKIDVIARVPGKYQGPASRAYLYYTDEHKIWEKGLECEITEGSQIISGDSKNDNLLIEL